MSQTQINNEPGQDQRDKNMAADSFRLLAFQRNITPQQQLICLKTYFNELNECFRSRMQKKQINKQNMMIYQEYKKMLKLPQNILSQVFDRQMSNMRTAFMRKKPNTSLKQKAQTLKKQIQQKLRRHKFIKK